VNVLVSGYVPLKPLAIAELFNSSLCYGCGRCLPACPYGLIQERDHRLGLAAVAELLISIRPDAIEIHTAPGHDEGFETLLQSLDQASLSLRRLAVSCGLEAHGMAAEELATTFWRRHARLRCRGFSPLWQLDGRPMSGDVGGWDCPLCGSALEGDAFHRASWPSPVGRWYQPPHPALSQ
jgi:ferredoxin